MSAIEFYVVTLGVFAAVNGIQVLGMNMQYGVAGILNFGYILLVAIGAYATGIAALPPASASAGTFYVGGFNWGFPWDLLFGVAVTVVLGLLLAAICFTRVSNWYLAITLSAISYGMYLLAGNYQPLVGGFNGLSNIPGPWQDQLTPGQFQIVMLIICLAALILVFVAFWRVERSPLGRTLRSIRENEVASRALGKPTLRYKTLAFLLGSAAAGLGGGLTAIYLGGWDPAAWLPNETLFIFAAVIIGGRGWTIGAFIGSLLIYDLIIEGSTFLPVIAGNVELVPVLQGIVIGVSVIAMLWLRPWGAFPEPKQRFGRLLTVSLGVRAANGRDVTSTDPTAADDLKAPR